VVCGGGTYVRSLARDIARAAGSAAHLVALRRTRVGAFDVRDTLPVPVRGETLPVRPALDALPHLPQLPLAAQDAARVRGGIAVAGLNPTGATQAALVHGEPPALVALAEWQDGRWQPRVVMHPVA
jgi:tRNA pseudouridine55 synthase